MLWQQHQGFHFVAFVMHICGAKFQEHHLNASKDIVFAVFYHFLVANNLIVPMSFLPIIKTPLCLTVLASKGFINVILNSKRIMLSKFD